MSFDWEIVTMASLFGVMVACMATLTVWCVTGGCD